MILAGAGALGTALLAVVLALGYVVCFAIWWFFFRSR